MEIAAFTAALLERTDLVALIGERVRIKKSGSTFTGCCPFHNEKTPSFHVYTDSTPPHYHCFGCGAHGDAISFVRETEQLGFIEALERLARRAGMEMPANRQRNEIHEQHRLLLNTMQEVAVHYQRLLRTHPQRHYAQDYLKQRGVSDDMIELYQLGFAPAERQLLSLEKDPARLARLRELKLVHRKDDGWLFDMFHNRLMFPIRDHRGRTVAFGGRTLGNDRSKYINSSETPIFHKSSELYGLWEARQQNRQLKQLIVVEGYLDVIALTQFGIPGAVATLGTATNEENLGHLLQTSSELVFCFDGDKAGLAAADKALFNVLPLFQAGHQIRFLILPDGEDPDSFVRKQGKSAFEERLTAAPPLSQFFFDSLGRDLDLAVPEQRMVLRKRSRDILDPLKTRPIYQVLNELSYERTRSPLWAAREALRNTRAAPSPDRNPPVRGRTALIIALQCVSDPAWAAQAMALLDETFSEPESQRLQDVLRWLRERAFEDRESLLLDMATNPDSRTRFGNLFDALPLLPDVDLLASEATDALRTMRVHSLEARFDRLRAQLDQQPVTDALKEQLQALIKEKQALQ